MHRQELARVQEFIYSRLQMKAKVYFDSFLWHQNSACENRMRTQQEDSSKTTGATRQMAEEVTLVSEGSQGPAKPTGAAQLRFSILGQLFLWEITLVPDHIL